MPAPQEILKLVERFDSQSEAYQSGKYNEAQIRAEFIDPLFKALGWDIHNEQGYAEAYKDAIHEDAIKIGGATEAPDLCFRTGGTRKFFVECKKPSVNIKDDVHPAYQLRRYAWSARLSLSILTDFHELAVYDCRAKPNKNDTSAIGRLMYFTSNQFAEKWDEFAAVFSREAVLKGSFDKFAESAKGRKGTASVDDAFLEEIERWRDMLARNIASRNEKLSQRELNFSVQRIIDRIIFLRISEDRGIEPYGRLMTLRNGERVYPRLCEFFQRADERYNSGIFCFTKNNNVGGEPPDELTLTLAIDDKVIKDIVGNLYYPESPYEFSVLPADILGQVYERFLGKVIRLTAGHQAKVEDKPEVRKAGGVYYTPTYIVDYIVKNTVGKLLEGKTPKQAAKLKILDPACGSGSFLLGAYQLLLDWHLVQYMKEPENWTKGREPKLYQHHKGGWKLTTAERKRILLNNIYGVDIDSQAVEVTKLSLLLKVLEGESQETITKQFELFHQRALPDLGSNIKCGNSLIGPDFYKDRQGELFGEDEMYRINAFDWQAEFSEIMSSGGFDAVIGNPPYGYLFNTNETDYLSIQFPVFATIADAYVSFIERGHNLLTKNGKFGFIIPSAWLGGPTYCSLREYLLHYTIDTIILLPFDVFRDAYVDTVVITTTKAPASSSHCVTAAEYPKKEKIIAIELLGPHVSSIKQHAWTKNEDRKFVLNVELLQILINIRKRVSERFDDFVVMKRGVLFDKELLTKKKISAESHPYFEGDVYRYRVNYVALQWVEYGPNMREYPKEFLWFEGPRILLRRLVNRQQRLMASVLDKTVITNKNLYTVKPSGKEAIQYCLGLFNSSLISRLYLSQVSQATKDDFPQVTIKDVLSLPFRAINFSNLADKSRHDKMVSLVDQMLDLHKRKTATKTDHERTLLERQISATDHEIDQMVYELYGLTASEIAIMEERGDRKDKNHDGA